MQADLLHNRRAEHMAAQADGRPNRPTLYPLHLRGAVARPPLPAGKVRARQPIFAARLQRQCLVGVRAFHGLLVLGVFQVEAQVFEHYHLVEVMVGLRSELNTSATGRFHCKLFTMPPVTSRRKWSFSTTCSMVPRRVFWSLAPTLGSR